MTGESVIVSDHITGHEVHVAKAICPRPVSFPPYLVKRLEAYICTEFELYIYYMLLDRYTTY